MSAVKGFIEKQLPRVWPHSSSLWPLDTDLSPPTCHSPTGNSHDPIQHKTTHMSMHIQLYILWTCNTCIPCHLIPFFVISYISGHSLKRWYYKWHPYIIIFHESLLAFALRETHAFSLYIPVGFTSWTIIYYLSPTLLSLSLNKQGGKGNI